jgi:3'(2'), 5'-bisphosphate nucleotidase
MPIRPPQSLKPFDLSRDELAQRLFQAARSGAQALMRHWGGDVRSTLKADGSPVSEADHAADAAVREALARLGLDAPLVSEESDEAPGADCESFLMLDPLDGTKDFLAHTEEFCVCLAAIHRGRAIAGAIVAPAMRRAWFAGETCHGADLDHEAAPIGAPRLLSARAPEPGASLRALVSRRHGDPRSLAALAACGVGATTCTSSAIKFGLLAEGQADIHVRHGRTMAWDIAAGDAILSAAGGLVRAVDGAPLRYDGPGGDFSNPPFVAVAREGLLGRVLEAVQRAG